MHWRKITANKMPWPGFQIEAKRTGESIKPYSLQTETLLRSSFELVVCSDSPTNFRYCKVVVLNKVDAEALNFY